MRQPPGALSGAATRSSGGWLITWARSTPCIRSARATGGHSGPSSGSSPATPGSRSPGSTLIPSATSMPLPRSCAATQNRSARCSTRSSGTTADVDPICGGPRCSLLRHSRRCARWACTPASPRPPRLTTAAPAATHTKNRSAAGRLPSSDAASAHAVITRPARYNNTLGRANQTSSL
jgi:hypothetical protein